MASIVKIENYINGNFVPSRAYLDSYDPCTGEVWAKVPNSGKLEVQAAVSAAKRAFTAWSTTPIDDRSKIMLRIANLIEESSDVLAELESKDQGKPIWLAKAVDIPRAVANFRHFAVATPHLLGTSKILGRNESVNYTTNSSIGVAGLISPWNLPLYLLTFKLAPAIVCGNTVVAKPSEFTSVTAYELCKILDKAGLPPGVVNIIFGTGQQVGEELVCHPDVPVISFTGSTATGKRIATMAAPMFKKLSLEMGGKNPSIVFADCDLKKAVAGHIRSSFINQGQVCLCTSRIYVQKSIFDDFVLAFVEETEKLKVGPASDKDVFLGAINSKEQMEKIKYYIAEAIKDGGKIECGETIGEAQVPIEYKHGYYLRPTIITGLTDCSKVMKEEIFGPVTCIVPFDTEEEVIQRANDTEYGLCATIWTSNLGISQRVANKLQVGTVWINCWLIRDMDLPFGGVKKSGCGREGTVDSFEFYTEKKTICMSIQQ